MLSRSSVGPPCAWNYLFAEMKETGRKGTWSAACTGDKIYGVVRLSLRQAATSFTPIQSLPLERVAFRFTSNLVSPLRRSFSFSLTLNRLPKRSTIIHSSCRHMERVQTDFQLAVGHLILAEIATVMIVIKVLNVYNKSVLAIYIIIHIWICSKNYTYSYIHNNI